MSVWRTPPRLSAHGGQRGEAVLELDPAQVRACLAQQPFLIGHRLLSHPLFTLERLTELAQRLPEASVEYNAGTLQPDQDAAQTPRTGLSIPETVRRIRECSSWMVLKNVEQDPEYGLLLDRCLGEMRRYSECVEPGMTQGEGFIFISSPNAVTPFHMDPELNFLLQIAGCKWIHQWDRRDRTVVAEEDLEHFFAASPQRNLKYRTSFETRARVFELLPGLGLHFPSMAPHWVQNGPEVSVSFSVTFRSHRTIEAAAAYRLNDQLRRWGFSPRPPGQTRVVDAAKLVVVRVLEKLARTARA